LCKVGYASMLSYVLIRVVLRIKGLSFLRAATPKALPAPLYSQVAQTEPKVFFGRLALGPWLSKKGGLRC
jgi:hypothetical protein